jgi:3-isopropylmalate/(R)-2-methylmalate dehydratase large subunit
MGSTIIEKILARAAGRTGVRPGDVVVCRPDMVVHLDMPMAIDGGWFRPRTVFDPERIALVFDHMVPASTIRDASAGIEGRRFAREFGIKRFFDVGRSGIAHVVAAENGLTRPGELLVCADSHTCAAGALNCAGRGTGLPDTLQAITKGVVWYPVAPTVRYEFQGRLAPWVSGKDVFFHIARLYGAHGNLNMEFGGPGLAALGLSHRRTIATMCAEVGAEFAIFEFDALTQEFLQGRLDRAATPVAPDPDAQYLDVRVIDLEQVEPHVVLPNSVPGNCRQFSSFDAQVTIDQAFIGSCANGLIEDLRVAADVVRGRQVAPGVRFIVTPGSQAIYLQAVREGLVATLIEAGALVTNSTCGACYGGAMGLLGPGEVCITASTRNFQGRMGSSEAAIYLASPATVAASAIAGVIADPRSLCAQGEPISTEAAQ